MTCRVVLVRVLASLFVAAPALAVPSALPATVAEVEALERAALAALPDVKVPLGAPLAAAALDGKSVVELRLMRNSIYAQYGVPFKTRWLREYFESRAWYRAQAKPESVVAPVDLDNARAILKREEASAPSVASRADVTFIALMDEAELKRLPDYRAPLGRPLDEQAMKKLSLTELKLMRNSIFAQHGKGDFVTPWLLAYFKTRPWFAPVAKPTPLDGVDTANVKLLKALEDQMMPKGQKLAAEVIDAGSCERVSGALHERFVFAADGKVTIQSGEANSAYPWDAFADEVEGEWRSSEGRLEVRRPGHLATAAFGPWSPLVLNAAKHRCR
jgi:hypothetical protein